MTDPDLAAARQAWLRLNEQAGGSEEAAIDFSEAVVRMFDGGQSPVQIARRLGVPDERIRAVLMEAHRLAVHSEEADGVSE